MHDGEVDIILEPNDLLSYLQGRLLQCVVGRVGADVLDERQTHGHSFRPQKVPLRERVLQRLRRRQPLGRHDVQQVPDQMLRVLRRVPPIGLVELVSPQLE